MVPFPWLTELQDELGRRDFRVCDVMMSLIFFLLSPSTPLIIGHVVNHDYLDIEEQESIVRRSSCIIDGLRLLFSREREREKRRSKAYLILNTEFLQLSPTTTTTTSLAVGIYRPLTLLLSWQTPTLGKLFNHVILSPIIGWELAAVSNSSGCCSLTSMLLQLIYYA